jgi:transaldolase
MSSATLARQTVNEHMGQFNGPLHEMAQTTPTNYLNDSCSVEELNYAIERGSVGATSNPVIVGNVLKKEMHLWKDRITQIVRDNPTWNETQVAWQVYEEVGVHGSKLLLPVWERTGHKLGRLSMQTDPALYRDPEAMLKQAEYFASLAPNIQIKIPCTSAGVSIIEKLTYRGINLNVTVSFCVPQVMAIAEHIERGLRRREREGKDTSTMTPYATMMVGRNDDWMKVYVKKNNIDIDPAHLEWCGVACFKKAYQLYQKQGYRTQLLSAAYRNFYHWTEFVGGHVSLTIPHEWQAKYNASDVRPTPRMDLPVDSQVLDALYTKIPEFRRAYEPNGMSVAEFDTFGATVRTLRSFIEAWHSFVGVIRDMMLPNPD